MTAWFGVAMVCLCAAASAVLEALLVPLYAGGVVFPIAVVFALAGNIVLPRLALVFVPRTLACVLPFVSWLVVIVVFGISARPEGDVILPGGGTLQYVSYGVMLGGALAGTISVVTATPTPASGSRR